MLDLLKYQLLLCPFSIIHLHTFILNDMMVQDSDSDIEMFNLLDPSIPGKVVGNISISCSVEVCGIPYTNINTI